MSKQRKKENGKALKQTAKPGSVVPILLLAVVVIAIAFWWWKSKENGSPAQQAKNGSTNAANAARLTGDPQRINGRWVRPDGGYVLEIKSDDGTGEVEALYFNPRPIHVAKTEMKRDGNNIKIFVELRDANYDGSTYDLTYQPESDQLKGVYFHAGLKQNFEVTFVRSQ